MSTNPFAAWTDQLIEYQRQYQDAWQALAQPAGLGPASREINKLNPWAAALEQWWQTVQPGASAPVQDFYGRLVEQGKVYFQVTESFNEAFTQIGAAGESAARWQEAVNTALGSLREVFASHDEGRHGAARQVMGFWELPLNNWQRAVSSLSILPGDMLQGVNALGVERVRDELHERVDQLLSTPAVGHMREHQEQFQTLAKLALDYQRALQDYMATYGQIGVRSVEALQQQIGRRVEEGGQVESLRELYDLWVDSSEHAYAEYVSTGEYVELYGRLINSLMALKRHGGMMVDDALAAMNMPTRGEIDTLHGRLHEMRWEEKALRAELDGMKDQFQKFASKLETQQTDEALRAKVENMNDELKSLVARQGVSPSASNGASPKKPVAPKKSVRKKSSAKKRSGTKASTSRSTSKRA